MADYDVDLFIIGAGSGGVRAARIAGEHGARVMIAEEDRVGGTCVIRGCVPKKLLVYGSHFAEELQDVLWQDLPDALPVPVLDRYLNTIRVPRFEATAVTGTGVFETLRAICKLVTNKL